MNEIDKILNDYDNGTNINQLRNKYDKGRKSIIRILKSNGREIKTKNQIIEEQLGLDAKELAEKYDNELFTIEDLAKYYNTNTQVIKTFMFNNGVPTKQVEQLAEERRLRKWPQLQDEQFLKQQYEADKKSITALSKDIGCGEGVLKRTLVKYGISIRDVQEAAIYRKSTPEQQQNAAIARNLRSRLSSALKNNSKKSSAVNDLGCSMEELRQHLESKFYDEKETGEKMTWDNYGRWELDHIHPLSKFDMSDEQEQKAASHYTNLQPLWRSDNRRKSNKVEPPLGLLLPKDKPKMYLVSGPSGSGKTWVCDQLVDVNYISFDTIPKIQHYFYMHNLCSNGKPLVYDPFRKVTTFFRDYRDLFDITVVLIKEEPDVVLSRLEGRGSTSMTIDKVNEAIKKLKKVERIADFVGTSDEVLAFLRSKLDEKDW